MNIKSLVPVLLLACGLGCPAFGEHNFTVQEGSVTDDGDGEWGTGIYEVYSPASPLMVRYTGSTLLTWADGRPNTNRKIHPHTVTIHHKTTGESCVYAPGDIEIASNECSGYVIEEGISPGGKWLVLPNGRFGGFIICRADAATLQEMKDSAWNAKFPCKDGTGLWHDFVRWENETTFLFTVGLSGYEIPFTFDIETKTVTPVEPTPLEISPRYAHARVTAGDSPRYSRPAPMVDDGYPDDSALRQQYGPNPDRSPRYILCRGYMCRLPWDEPQYTGFVTLPHCTRGSDGSRMEDGHPYYSPLVFAMLDDERMNHPLQGVTYKAPYIQGLAADEARGVVLQLIEENKDNCVNDCYHYNHTTPLAIAVRNNDLELAGLLLRKGADPRRCAGEGLALLQTAADFGNVEMVKLLLRHGANPLTRNGRPFSHPFDESETDPDKLKCRILILEAQTRLLAP